MESTRDNQLIDRVREANDLVEVVSGYVRLKRAGNTYKGLCPFHSEKTPSFTVSADKQVFYCFGCQSGGNVFHFIMKIENLDFLGALRFLAERAGIPLPEQGAEADSPAKERRTQLQRVLELAARFYRFILEQHALGAEGREYATKRQLDAAILARFEVGFAPNAWDGLVKFLAKRQVDLALAEEAGLLLRRRDGGYYDRFRNRLMLPIRDARGRAIGFGGRSVDGSDPKYLNSPETKLFRKGETLYGLNLAAEGIRKAGYAVVVEGYLDAVACHRHGYPQAVASLGTALTEAQVRLLGRYATEVRIAYDADAAGQAATWRGLDLISAAGFRVKVVSLPSGEDPDSFLRQQGAGPFGARLAEAESLLSYKLGSIARRSDLGTTEGKVQAVKSILPVLSGLESPVAREQYLSQVAATFGVSVGALEEELAQATAGGSVRPVGRNKFPDGVKNIRGQSSIEQGGAEDERGLVTVLLAHPEAVGALTREVSPESLENHAVREIVLAVLAAAAAGERVDAAGLAGRVTEESQAYLSALLVGEDSHLKGVDPAAFFRRFRQKQRERQLTKFEAEIETAAAAGGLARLNDLLVEYRWWQEREGDSAGKEGRP